MGYRFRLEHANIIAHIVEGDFLGFIDSVILALEDDKDIFDSFKYIIGEFVNDYYTSSKRYSLVKRDIKGILPYFESTKFEADLRTVISFAHNIYSKDVKRADYDPEFESAENYIRLNRRNKKFILEKGYPFNQLREIFSKLYGHLGRCKVKTMLIPGLDSETRDISYELIDPGLLSRLVYGIHPEDSCLILQVKEIPNDIRLLGAFKGMDVAFQHIHEWPGVLLWGENLAPQFISIKNINDLEWLYRKIHVYLDGNTPNIELKGNINSDIKSRYTHILHMSDLHLGLKETEWGVNRLLTLLEEERKSIDCAFNPESTKLYSVITGDMVHSPDEFHIEAWSDFKDELAKRAFVDPIYVFGNHDYEHKGIRWNPFGNSKFAMRGLYFEPVEIIEDLKLVIIKIDSNEDGFLARGRVSETEMQRVGIKWNEYKNKGYGCVALLHHHPTKVEEPSWYRGNFWRKLLNLSGYETTLALQNSDEFMKWAEINDISIILHGHRHIPHFKKINEKINVIGCGSSTGKVEHKNRLMTYLSYNLLKYDRQNYKFVSCVSKFEDKIGSGVRHLYAENLS